MDIGCSSCRVFAYLNKLMHRQIVVAIVSYLQGIIRKYSAFWDSHMWHCLWLVVLTWSDSLLQCSYYCHMRQKCHFWNSTTLLIFTFLLVSQSPKTFLKIAYCFVEIIIMEQLDLTASILFMTIGRQASKMWYVPIVTTDTWQQARRLRFLVMFLEKKICWNFLEMHFIISMVIVQ